MDKKEILEKNRQNSRHMLDEREKRVYNYSFGLGAIVVGVLCVVFSIYQVLHHHQIFEFAAIITAYLSTTFLYQFKNIRRPLSLVAGIVTGAAAVLSLILFFTGGLS